MIRLYVGDNMGRLMQKIDKPLFILSVILLAFGIIMILIASNMKAFIR